MVPFAGGQVDARGEVNGAEVRWGLAVSVTKALRLLTAKEELKNLDCRDI